MNVMKLPTGARLSLAALVVLAVGTSAALIVSQQSTENRSKAAVTTTSTFSSTADSYVKNDQPNANFGTSTVLYVDSGSPTAIAYIKFDLTSLAGKDITGAVFQVKTGSEASAGTQNVKSVVDTSWGENSIVYNNRPALGSTLGTINSHNYRRAWQSVDVLS
jgi:hypothetical protein